MDFLCYIMATPNKLKPSWCHRLWLGSYNVVFVVF